MCQRYGHSEFGTKIREMKRKAALVSLPDTTPHQVFLHSWGINNETGPRRPPGDGKPCDKHITSRSTSSGISAHQGSAALGGERRCGGTTKAQRKTAGGGKNLAGMRGAAPPPHSEERRKSNKRAGGARLPALACTWMHKAGERGSEGGQTPPGTLNSLRRPQAAAAFFSFPPSDTRRRRPVASPGVSGRSSGDDARCLLMTELKLLLSEEQI